MWRKEHLCFGVDTFPPYLFLALQELFYSSRLQVTETDATQVVSADVKLSRHWCCRYLAAFISVSPWVRTTGSWHLGSSSFQCFCIKLSVQRAHVSLLVKSVRPRPTFQSLSPCHCSSFYHWVLFLLIARHLVPILFGVFCGKIYDWVIGTTRNRVYKHLCPPSLCHPSASQWTTAV